MSEILYEGVRFSDGSCAVRRIDPDPCERCTRTFESVRELNEELGRHEVIRWLADGCGAIDGGRTVTFVTLRTWEPTRRGQAVSSYPCGCCGEPSNPKRMSIPRCDWCMSHCRIATGVHTKYEKTEETDEP